MSGIVNPGSLRVDSIVSLINTLHKIEKSKGNVDVLIKYMEYGDSVIIKVGDGRIKEGEPYLVISMELHHGGELVEGI